MEPAGGEKLGQVEGLGGLTARRETRRTEVRREGLMTFDLRRPTAARNVSHRFVCKRVVSRAYLFIEAVIVKAKQVIFYVKYQTKNIKLTIS